MHVRSIGECDSQKRLRIQDVVCGDLRKFTQRRSAQQSVQDHLVSVAFTLKVKGVHQLQVINIQWADGEKVRRHFKHRAMHPVRVFECLGVDPSALQRGLAHADPQKILIVFAGLKGYFAIGIAMQV